MSKYKIEYNSTKRLKLDCLDMFEYYKNKQRKDMNYYEQIREITKIIPTTIVDFSLPRNRTNPPTQASSNFITNKEQGDWAEDLIFRAINETSKNYIAIRYGKSDDLIAGEDGFDKFYNNFQDELDTIGKRPDLLIFKKADFDKKLGFDISKIEHSLITNYVKKAIAGLEIRSSAFLIQKYEKEMNDRTNYYLKIVFEIKKKILTNYKELLEQKGKKYIDILESITEESIQIISFRRPSWNATEELSTLTNLFKELKEAITIIQKRDYLSITPKVEDLKVVYKWIETFNVPHFYFQLFFDKSYAISFKNILQMISQPDKEGEYYEIGKDIKNQNKTTIKINTKKTTQIAYKIDEPEHKSIKREMGRGRLLFYVTFNGGTAYLDIDNLKQLLNIDDF
jgi:type II restriction enzyme